MKAVWVTPETDFTGYPDCSFSPIASVRYRALIPARELRARGHRANVVGLSDKSFQSVRDEIADAQSVIFRKNYYDAQCTERMLEEARAAGLSTLFDLSDDLFSTEEGSHLQRMIEKVDTVITASTLLQRVVTERAHRESFVVADPFEGPRGEARAPPTSGRLKGLWFGHPTNLPSLFNALQSLVEAGKKRPVDLRIVTLREDGLERACKEINARYRHALTLRLAEWSMAETWNSLANSDFVLIPASPGERKTLAKSPNRIIESLWGGRFVVSHPIPSYLEFKDWAWIGGDLVEGIGWMVENAPLLEGRIRAAQEYIEATYSPARIAAQWESVLEKA